ncbi:MAG: pepsin-like aspartic protease [Myxococcota bacterium]
MIFGLKAITPSISETTAGLDGLRASDDHQDAAVKTASEKTAQKEQLIHRPAEYFLTLAVGGDEKSRQEIEAVFDSGSSNLIMWDKKSCKNNSGCKEKTSYDMNKDKGATKAGKDFSLAYGSATATATPVQTKVGALCGPQAPAEIGVITQGRNAPNILGAAYSPIAQPGEAKAFFDTYFEQTGEDQIFGMLFCGAKLGSQIELGARLEELAGDNREFSWTPVIHQTYYVVHVLSAKIAGETENLGENFPAPPGKEERGVSNVTILDSGATFSRIPQTVFQALVTKLKNIATQKGVPLPAGFFGETASLKAITAEMTASDLSHFPTLEFQLIGGKTQQEALADKEASFQNVTDETPITLKLGPEHYFKVMGKGKKHAKRAFSFRAGTNLLILGQPFFESHYVEIIRKDDQGNAYIGFASNDGLCG